MNRLNQNNLDQLPKNIVRPTYNRDSLKAGIVHLGIGAFHRVHQAVYTDQVLAEFGGDWGIVGGDLRSNRIYDQLTPQDCLYSVAVKDNDQQKIQVIGSVIGVSVGPENPAKLIALMADESIKLVSITVTEKGYCHDPATGNLNLRHPQIQYDLKNIDEPKSTPGYIVSALQQRRAKGIKSFTLLSCDNLPNNGKVLRNVVLQFARLYDADLADWIAENTTFPCTMVDRIAPAVTDDDLTSLDAQLGMRDEGGVVCEPFRQWVIEDNFCNDRPAWEKVGALVVEDVEIFEHMKLRLLNGSHSLLAYCGYLSGFETISDVMTEPSFVAMCKDYMDSAGDTLEAPEGFDIEDYKQQLRVRYSNRGLQHRTWQIAMDGSQKLPQRLLDTLRDQLKNAADIDIICIAVAAWMRYVSGVDEKGEAIEVRDPLAAQLRKLCDDNKGDPAAMVNALMGVTEIFGTDLKSIPTVVEGVTGWLNKFYEQGVLASVRAKFPA